MKERNKDIGAGELGVQLEVVRGREDRLVMSSDERHPNDGASGSGGEDLLHGVESICAVSWRTASRLGWGVGGILPSLTSSNTDTCVVKVNGDVQRRTRGASDISLLGGVCGGSGRRHWQILERAA